ncbi:MAG: hypothetical protein L0Y72_07995 [Gemmataceae bacterium]|nr:hypothetical protein [Gemmataceae bacterium]MCI0738969.1 hypothetical protein [Gemmataceae bacterium]
MKARSIAVAIVALFVSATSVWAQAEVLQVIPDDAAGFVMVNRVGAANDKLTGLAQRMKIPMPGSPLEKMKELLGVQKSFAEKSNAAVAIFAGDDGSKPQALIFMPVSDYATFLGEVKAGAPKEGVSEITLKVGKIMLAGKKGSFAVLAEPENRAVLQRALKSDKNLAAWAQPLSGWLAESEVAGVLTGRGIKMAVTQARKSVEEGRKDLADLPAEAQILGKFFDFADGYLRLVESDVTHAGLGARLDSAGNLHVNAQARFRADSGFAKAGASVKAPAGGPLAGLPSGPFVLALGGALPENGMQALVNLNMEMLKAGGQGIPAETLKKLEETYAQLMKGMSGMGFVWQVGKENQPVFANLAAAMHTSNAAAYLANYVKSIGVMNEVFKELNLPFLPAYELKKTKVNGTQALELSMDVAAGLGLPEDAQKIFESIFGPGGKMTTSMAARDDKTIVMRYAKADGLKDMLSGKGLSGDAEIVQATKALPAGSQWALYVSPKGLTDFADRTVKAFLPIPLQVPQFPATPPVAAAARISGQGFEVHAVVPSGVLENVGGFIEQAKRMFGRDF